MQADPSLEPFLDDDGQAKLLPAKTEGRRVLDTTMYDDELPEEEELVRRPLKGLDPSNTCKHNIVYIDDKLAQGQHSCNPSMSSTGRAYSARSRGPGSFS